MSLLTVTPVNLTPGGATPTDLTTALAAGVIGSNTGIVFPNTGREVVFVQITAATTVTSDIGTTVLGQTVPGVQDSLSGTGIYMFGPYPSQYDKQDGTNDVEIDFGTPASVSGIAVVHIPGVS